MPRQRNVFVVIGGGLWRRGSKGWKWAKRNLVVHRHKPKPRPKPPVPPTPPKPPPFKPLEGIDFAARGLTGAQAKAAGKHFVMRYIAPRNAANDWKRVTKAEIADFHAHGIKVGLVFEGTGGRAKEGYAAGVSDAQQAIQEVAALGLPATTVVYFAVDFDPHGHEAQITAYFKGVFSKYGHAHTGYYGGGAGVAASGAPFVWQATAAWSWGLPVPGRHIEQYRNGQHVAGHSVDLDRQLRPSAGLF